MARLAAPEGRAKLLDEIVEYILDHGLASLSLRPLAAALKTSPQMLLYFFGSKEELISEVLVRIRLRQQVDFVRAVSGTGRRKELFLRAWNAWSSQRMGKFWRFCFGVYGLALQNRNSSGSF
jgi:AcrR family transcriptional regulator